VSALPAASLTTKAYSASSETTVPEVNGSPFSVAVPSSKDGVTALLYTVLSVTPVTTGGMVSAASLAIAKRTTVSLPAASVTTSVYLPFSVTGVPDVNGEPFSVAVPSSKDGVTAPLYTVLSVTPVTTGGVVSAASLSSVKRTTVSLPAASVTTSMYSPSAVIGVPEVNGSPFSVAVPSSKDGVTATLYTVLSVTPVTIGGMVSAASLAIVKRTTVSLPAASVTTSLYSPSAVTGVPDVNGSPFSVAVPSLNSGFTSSL